MVSKVLLLSSRVPQILIFESKICAFPSRKFSWDQQELPFKLQRKGIRLFCYHVTIPETDLWFIPTVREHSCCEISKFVSFHFSVSVFLSTLAKPEFRLVTLVGSCTAWSMEFSLMVKCPVTRQSVEEMIPSTHFSARLEQENTFLAPSLLIWNQLSLVS